MELLHKLYLAIYFATGLIGRSYQSIKHKMNSMVNYQIIIGTNAGYRSGTIAVLAYMTFIVCPTPLHHQSIMLLLCIGSQCSNEAAVWIPTS